MTDESKDTAPETAPDSAALVAAAAALHEAEAAIEAAQVAQHAQPSGAVTISAEGIAADGTIPMVVFPRATVEQLLGLAEEVERNIPGHTGRSIESVGRAMRLLLLGAEG